LLKDCKGKSTVKNHPVWFNFIDIDDFEYLLEMVMCTKTKVAYVFGYDVEKLFNKIYFKGNPR